MGISYGQLYRWKREGLIPDGWFVKRSSFTGQETYLPRERVLERIRFITEHKERYTLRQLQALLSPEAEKRMYEPALLMRVSGTFRALERVSSLTGARHFSHGQALCILIGTDMLAHCEMDERQLTRTMKALLSWQEERRLFGQTDGRLALLKTSSGTFPLFLCGDVECWTPEDVTVAFEVHLSDVAARYGQQLNELVEE